jgi:hypothetical protein
MLLSMGSMGENIVINGAINVADIFAKSGSRVRHCERGIDSIGREFREIINKGDDFTKLCYHLFTMFLGNLEIREFL